MVTLLATKVNYSKDRDRHLVTCVLQATIVATLLATKVNHSKYRGSILARCTLQASTVATLLASKMNYSEDCDSFLASKVRLQGWENNIVNSIGILVNL